MFDILSMPGDASGVCCWPKEVAVPMNWGGRSNHASLKLRPSPKEGMLYWSAVMSSKNELRSLLSESVKSGAPGGGSGGSARFSWVGSILSRDNTKRDESG
jgi:hypothetical protein